MTAPLVDSIFPLSKISLPGLYVISQQLMSDEGGGSVVHTWPNTRVMKWGCNVALDAVLTLRIHLFQTTFANEQPIVVVQPMIFNMLVHHSMFSEILNGTGWPRLRRFCFLDGSFGTASNFPLY